MALLRILISRASVRVEPALWMPAHLGASGFIVAFSRQPATSSSLQPRAHCSSTGFCVLGARYLVLQSPSASIGPGVWRNEMKNAYATAMLYADLPSPRRLSKGRVVGKQVLIVFTLSGETHSGTLQFLPFNQLAQCNRHWHYRPFALLSSHRGGGVG